MIKVLLLFIVILLYVAFTQIKKISSKKKESKDSLRRIKSFVRR